MSRCCSHASSTLRLQRLTCAASNEKTLLAFADHGQVKGVMPADGGDAEQVLAEFALAGVHHAELAEELQREGAEAFDRSWNDLMDCLRSKSEELQKAS